MAIDRKAYTTYFTEDEVPAWKCPTCGHATLEVAKDGKQTKIFECLSSEAEKELERIGEYSPEYAEGVFSAILMCPRAGCREKVAVLGDYFGDVDTSGQFTRAVGLYHPLHFHPAIRIISIPAAAEPGLRMEIEAAFQVFWCDTAACLNHIRGAIELLLSEMNVPRFGKKKRRLSLNERIRKMPPKYKDLSDSLDALRWLGNAGSHPLSQVNRQDSMDGFELLEHVLEEHFDPRHKRLKKISGPIRKRKGPRKKTLE